MLRVGTRNLRNFGLLAAGRGVAPQNAVHDLTNEGAIRRPSFALERKFGLCGGEAVQAQEAEDEPAPCLPFAGTRASAWGVPRGAAHSGVVVSSYRDSFR
jgi:hypothetical protein